MPEETRRSSVALEEQEAITLQPMSTYAESETHEQGSIHSASPQGSQADGQGGGHCLPFLKKVSCFKGPANTDDTEQVGHPQDNASGHSLESGPGTEQPEVTETHSMQEPVVDDAGASASCKRGKSAFFSCFQALGSKVRALESVERSFRV